MWLEQRAAGESGDHRRSLFSRETGRKSRSPSRHRAFERLYREEVQALRMYTHRLVKDGSDAEDIVQEAFVRLWRILDDDAIKCPRAVLFTTARNLGLNHIRNKRVRNSDATQWAIAETSHRIQTTAEAQLIAAEDAEACRGLLEALPLRCREAFVLRVVEELSYKQMAAKMRLSVSTVEKHIGKGKQIIKTRIAGARIPTEYDAFRPEPRRGAAQSLAHAIAAE